MAKLDLQPVSEPTLDLQPVEAPSLDLQPVAAEQQPENLALRFGKQLWNRGVANVLHTLGKSDVTLTDIDVAEAQRQRIAARKKAGEKPFIPRLLDDEFEDIKRQLNLVPAARGDDDLKAFTQHAPVEDPFALPVGPPRNTVEKIADVTAGLAAFIGQISIAGKALPKGTPAPVVWETVTQASGGKPGEGAAMAATLGIIGKIPAVSAAGKAAKVGATSLTFGGMTAIAGGDTEDILISAMVPVALAGIQAGKGKWTDSQTVKAWNKSIPWTKDIPRGTSIRMAKMIREAAKIQKTGDVKLREGQQKQFIKKYNKAVEDYKVAIEKARPVGRKPVTVTEPPPISDMQIAPAAPGAEVPAVTPPTPAVVAAPIKPTKAQFTLGHQIPDKVLKWKEPKRREFMKQFMPEGFKGQPSMKKMDAESAQRYVDALRDEAMKQGKLELPVEGREFSKPRIYGTPQLYNIEKQGTYFMVEPLVAGKYEFVEESAKRLAETGKWFHDLKKEGGETAVSKAKAKLFNKPTATMIKMSEALHAGEEAPENISDKEIEIFNSLRGLSIELWERENASRKKVGRELIPYRAAYFRHVLTDTFRDMIQGRHPIPENVKYWMQKNVKGKVTNPMEMERKIEEFADIFSRDLEMVTNSMLHTALKEIHLDEPLKYFKDQMYLHSDVIPAESRTYLEKWVKVYMEGFQSEFDKTINDAVVKWAGPILNPILAKFGREISRKPVSRLFTDMGRMMMYGVMGPRPKQLIRNKFQLLQNLAFFSNEANLKSFQKDPIVDKMIENHPFFKSYVGFEEFDELSKHQFGKYWMAGFRWTAVTNAQQAMRAAYWDKLPYFTDPKYKDLGWADPQRTYEEPPRFLYPSEEKIMSREMEFDAGATQYHYIAMAMPDIFRHKTLAPFTRLTSWFWFHSLQFQREALGRAIRGTTGTGRKLPNSARWRYLKYLVVAGITLNLMGYYRSFLVGTAPTGMPPMAQFLLNLGAYFIHASPGGDERAKKTAARKTWQAAKMLIPGYLAYKDWKAMMETEGDWERIKKLFFYNKGLFKEDKDQGLPP